MARSPEIRLSPAVRYALSHSRPVVALESTIIAHGLPHPTNHETALSLEAAVVAQGAVPATVAVLRGVPHVGLTASQLRHLADPRTRPRKLSRRDLPLAYAAAHTGATTVAATMAISHAAGVRVFATGGIGGVHRRVARSWDVSPDIAALASIPQIVVCAGAKSILDLPKTLEALESASVPVLVLRSTTFPAFYSPGRLPAPAVVQGETQAARVFHMARASCAPHAVLLAVPVPEEHAADAASIERATETALNEMARRHPPLLPKQVTPFLLKRVAEITGGESLRANVALAKNNAAVAARVAVALSRIQTDTDTSAPGIAHSPLSGNDVEGGREKGGIDVDVLVVGGVTLDIHCDAARGLQMTSGASNAGRIRQCAGGVAKNVAEAVVRAGGARVRFVSTVGDDVAGKAVLHWVGEGVGADAIRVVAGRRTATCCVVHNPKGDLAVRRPFELIRTYKSALSFSQKRKRADTLERIDDIFLLFFYYGKSDSDCNRVFGLFPLVPARRAYIPCLLLFSSENCRLPSETLMTSSMPNPARLWQRAVKPS